jgi:hypothetical protein
MTDWITFKKIQPPSINPEFPNMRIYLVAEMRVACEKYIIPKFEATTVFWKSNRPKFTARQHSSINDNFIQLGVDVDNPIWNHIDKGAKIKDYIPRIGIGRLGTYGGYIRGSMPNTLVVGPSGIDQTKGYLSLNQPLIGRRIKARNFSKKIAEQVIIEGEVKTHMQDTFNEIVRTFWSQNS